MEKPETRQKKIRFSGSPNVGSGCQRCTSVVLDLDKESCRVWGTLGEGKEQREETALSQTLDQTYFSHSSALTAPLQHLATLYTAICISAKH